MIMFDLLLVQSFDVEYCLDLEIWARSHSRSFKLVLFDTVTYLPSIVTMVLSCIVCVI